MSKETFEAVAEIHYGRGDKDVVAAGHPITDAVKKALGTSFKALVAAGAIRPTTHIVIVEPEPARKASDEEVLKAIAGLVDDNNDEHFTRTGKPREDVLAARIGATVTTDQRDKLWSQIEKELAGTKA